jgi:hypothetical protein
MRRLSMLGRARFTHWTAPVHVLGAALLIAASASLTQAARHVWRDHVDPDYGTSAEVPVDVFEQQSDTGDVPGAVFTSADGRAQLQIGAWENLDGRTLGEFRRQLVEDQDHESITYSPSGRSWFVLSGYRDGDIVYYEKVIFSCDRQVVNALAIAYPVEQRSLYDPIVEHIEDSFRSGDGCP